jgi:hypothetical protein
MDGGDEFSNFKFRILNLYTKLNCHILFRDHIPISSR